ERSKLLRLAALDSVQWIDAGPGPLVPDNPRTRIFIGADALQKFPAPSPELLVPVAKGLTGRGVQVGIFDHGINAHEDFTGRLIVDDPRRSLHGTHLAGIIGGSGVLTARAGGRPFNARGMAPGAELLDIYQKPPHGLAGANTGVHWHYIAEYGMDVSNHSYAI